MPSLWVERAAICPDGPSPAAGEGPSGQVTACFTHSLGSVTFCDWLAETKLKINLISVV